MKAPTCASTTAAPGSTDPRTDIVLIRGRPPGGLFFARSSRGLRAYAAGSRAAAAQNAGGVARAYGRSVRRRADHRASHHFRGFHSHETDRQPDRRRIRPPRRLDRRRLDRCTAVGTQQSVASQHGRRHRQGQRLPRRRRSPRHQHQPQHGARAEVAAAVRFPRSPPVPGEPRRQARAVRRPADQARPADRRGLRDPAPGPDLHRDRWISPPRTTWRNPASTR